MHPRMFEDGNNIIKSVVKFGHHNIPVNDIAFNN